MSNFRGTGQNLVKSENKEEMTTFLKTIGSNHVLENRQFVFAPKTQYRMTAERLVVSVVEPSEANQNSLTFPFWCPREESNLYSRFRKPMFYPLNYEGVAEEVGLEPTNPLLGSGFQDRCNSHYAIPPIIYYHKKQYLSNIVERFYDPLQF